MNISDFTIANTHVPSNPREENPQVRWKVTLSHKGIPIGVFDYSTGMGHVPGYQHNRGRETLYQREVRLELVRLSCEQGERGVIMKGGGISSLSKKLLTGPTAVDFLQCLATDAMDWLNSESVEDFAVEFGYDEMGYAGAKKADEAFAACGVAYKAFASCGADADAITDLHMACDEV